MDSHPPADQLSAIAVAAAVVELPTSPADTGGLSLNSPVAGRPESASAATKLQKVYRSYRTRRRLADSAVVAEELWWQAIDFARLSHSTVSFFDHMKNETAISRWNRVRLIASKVGQGLSKDAKALKLAFQHWIEAIDPRHRYGHNLHFYYEEWSKSQAGQPFFYWLDIGDGRNLDLEECPRSLLRKQCVKYLGPQERQQYEYTVVDGKIMHKHSGVLLDTTSAGSKEKKWIFVMSTSSGLYAGQKKKGIFHHSSFLAGGATVAAGRFTAENGILKCIWAYSGHYRPSEENFNKFLGFLKENGVNMDQTRILSSSNEDFYDDKPLQVEKMIDAFKVSKPPTLVLPMEVTNNTTVEPTGASSQADDSLKPEYKRTLSGGLQSPKADVSKEAILERINSKRKASSYHLGHQLSSRWCSGAGPRIGCVADYPLELRVQALEFVNLSPRVSG
ncbi:IQ domain-containing protein IQM3-like isoform X2 [Canna indica]|uniref:IQ domain-containing protein IQM3-like isoform X2 n=1 Tax=Canna indica TaxID=4628 RepID=A0AAQ3JW85_9LILI|nr:IQ domain-containing protein IQM3-like isoform X2 [Canna indica]